MAKVSEQAEILMALITVGGGSVRTDGGLLDKALCETRTQLPPALQELSFSTTSVGFRCLELPDLLQMAMFMMAAEYGDGDHANLRSKIPTNEAHEIAIGCGMKVVAFCRLGQSLVAHTRPNNQ